MKRMQRPIAFVGRVPCKVDSQYGAIKAGDRITSSPTPGHAMLQTKPGPSIGIALEDWNGGTGKIMVLVQPGWHGIEPSNSEDSGLAERIAELERQVKALKGREN
jgi:hypothetical protein